MYFLESQQILEGFKFLEVLCDPFFLLLLRVQTVSHFSYLWQNIPIMGKFIIGLHRR